jgi:acetyl esterase
MYLLALLLSLSESIRSHGALALDDLWEDTAVTRALPHHFRIYSRKALPSRLHQQLRLYAVYPQDAQPADRRPAIIFIHGGGWGAGNPDQWFPHCRYFALRGLVGMSVQYRLTSEKSVTVADCVRDCQSAIRYIRAHSNSMGVDAQRLVVVGESAGGHLAAALGTISAGAGEDSSISGRPSALVLLNPITDLNTRWGETLGTNALAWSPLQHISKETPPTLLIHGDADRVVDFGHSQEFHHAMLALGNRSRLIRLPGADHAFAIFKYGPDRWVRRTIAEIDLYLCELGYLGGKPLLDLE